MFPIKKILMEKCSLKKVLTATITKIIIYMALRDLPNAEK